MAMPPERARWTAQEIARRVQLTLVEMAAPRIVAAAAHLRETPGFDLEVDWKAAKVLRP